MFTRSYLGHPFQPPTFGASPFASAGGITPYPSQVAGYNPLLSSPTPQVSAMGAFGGYNPILPQIGSYGFNPYQAAQVTGGIPVPAAHLWAGQNPALNPAIHPQVAAQLAAVNPGVLPNLVPQVWGGPFGQYSPPGMVNPLFQQMGSETSQFGQTPYYGQFSPYGAQDPITSAVLAQQLNPLAQQRLPIRPLTGPQQVDPYQVGLSGLTGSPIGQMVDPYSALTQAQLMSQYGINPFQQQYGINPFQQQYGINPFQQMPRPYPLGSWPGSPYPMGQPPAIGQIGVPFNL